MFIAYPPSGASRAAPTWLHCLSARSPHWRYATTFPDHHPIHTANPP